MKNLHGQIHKTLIRKHKTIAVAESCTGGMLCGLLTKNPGSSAYFILGVVAYSNKAKESALGIPLSLIKKKGAVCATVARAMAESIRKTAKADLGVGITGIAGPAGGTSAKPVGTVFIAAARKDKTICKKFHFKGNRADIRKKSASKALELLKTLL